MEMLSDITMQLGEAARMMRLPLVATASCSMLSASPILGEFRDRGPRLEHANRHVCINNSKAMDGEYGRKSRLCGDLRALWTGHAVIDPAEIVVFTLLSEGRTGELSRCRVTGQGEAPPQLTLRSASPPGHRSVKPGLPTGPGIAQLAEQLSRGADRPGPGGPVFGPNALVR